jgi:hypothetical protein
MDAVVSCESDKKYLVLCLSCLACVLTCRAVCMVCASRERGVVGDPTDQVWHRRF